MLSARPRFGESTFAVFAFALPFCVALGRATMTGHFDGDASALRDLALVPTGIGGGPSMALGQLASLFPLGSLPFRHAAIACLALGLASLLVFRVVLRALRSVEGESPSLLFAPALAFLGAQLGALSPFATQTATVGLDAPLAVALGLYVVDVVTRAPARSTHPGYDLLKGGVALGALFAESLHAGVAVVAALAAFFAIHRAATHPRVVRLAGVTAVFTWIVLVAFPVLRAGLHRSAFDLGASVLHDPLSSFGRSSVGVQVFAREVGLLPLAFAALSLGMALAFRRGRGFAALLAALIAADLCLVAVRSGTGESVAGSVLLAMMCLGGSTVLGVHRVVSHLARLRIPLHRPLSALLVAIHFTMLALVAEEAGERFDRSRQTGSDLWMSEALLDAPPNAVIVASSSARALRILSAQLIGGERPDVTLVPKSWIHRGTLAAAVLEKAHATEPVIASILLHGTTDELSLSLLAQDHPTRLEYDRAWDNAVRSHLTVDGAFVVFEPEPQGRSDRKPTNERARISVARMAGAFDADAPRDDAFLAVLSEDVREQIQLLMRVGDPVAAASFVRLMPSERPHPDTKKFQALAILPKLFVGARARSAMLEVRLAEALAKTTTEREGRDRRATSPKPSKPAKPSRR